MTKKEAIEYGIIALSNEVLNTKDNDVKVLLQKAQGILNEMIELLEEEFISEA